MSHAPSATHSAPAAARATAERHSDMRSTPLTREFRTRLVAAGLALSSLASAAALLWSPGPDRDDHTYASFAAGIYAYFNLAWYATEPNAIPASAGSALMSYVADNPVHLAALQAPGLFLFSLGALLLAAALWRSSAAARWVPVALVIVAIAQFLTPSTALDFVQAAMVIPFLGIAWLLWQKTTLA